MKEKIGITTWYSPGNYGTGLQAMALSSFLSNLGYDVYMINDKRLVKNNVGIIFKIEHKLMRFISGEWFIKQKYKDRLIVKEGLQSDFLNEYQNIYEINNDSDVDWLNNNVHLFVSGGDQIWNPYFYEKMFFLDFVYDNDKKISFGTSVGVNKIPEELKNEYRNNLCKYKKISVREPMSKEALADIVDQVEVVGDPTLLLSNKMWNHFLNKASIDKKKYSMPFILCYFVGERRDYWKYVEKMHKDTGYNVVVVPINKASYQNNYEKYVEVSPAEFLWLINNATIICTDSFHATLFSIRFKKEIYILKRFLDGSIDSQNGRIYDLLNRYHLEKLIIDDESSFKRNQNIDYGYAEKCIVKESENARKWLIEAIEQ